MFLKCHQHLHPIVKYEIAEKNIDVDNNLDVCEMIISCNELTRELANKQILSFMHYHVKSKEIKCPLEWWVKHESLFSKVGFLFMQILNRLGSEIETKRIFSLARILINLKRCHLQFHDLENPIFVSKN
jgi:hypothetical protein